eukprot:365456-Chlamydomonas_euryale.AAC.19
MGEWGMHGELGHAWGTLACMGKSHAPPRTPAAACPQPAEGSAQYSACRKCFVGGIRTGREHGVGVAGPAPPLWWHVWPRASKPPARLCGDPAEGLIRLWGDSAEGLTGLWGDSAEDLIRFCRQRTGGLCLCVIGGR